MCFVHSVGFGLRVDAIQVTLMHETLMDCMQGFFLVANFDLDRK